VYAFKLTEAEPRLQRRYERLVMSHLSCLHAVAAGLRALPDVADSFAATQAAWRFYANARVTLPQLAQPLIDCARTHIPQACGEYLLVALDWSGLHFDHVNKPDRVELFHNADLGYELFTALALSDIDGRPLAPLALDLRAGAGLHTTRSKSLLPVPSQLDTLKPMMDHVAGLDLGKTPVFIIDREGDSVGHQRQLQSDGRLFLIRANDSPRVFWNDQQMPLRQAAKALTDQEPLKEAGSVLFKGTPAHQYVGQTRVIIRRPARMHRTSGTGKPRRKRHHNVAGEPLTLRLIVSEIRDDQGHILATWLLLSNLPESVSAAQVAWWYYWRWQIESFHKLIKGAGLHVEQWQQESAGALARRLLVAAMALTWVWQLARDQRREAHQMQRVLVGLSGRQMKRGKEKKTFTIPALLAGLGVLMPMLCLLEQYPLQELRTLAAQTFPFSRFHPPPSTDDPQGFV
jgi:hypothetical protein